MSSLRRKSICRPAASNNTGAHPPMSDWCPLIIIAQSQTIESASTRVSHVALNSRTSESHTATRKGKEVTIHNGHIESTTLNWSCHPGWMSARSMNIKRGGKGEIDKGRKDRYVHMYVPTSRYNATSHCGWTVLSSVLFQTRVRFFYLR